MQDGWVTNHCLDLQWLDNSADTIIYLFIIDVKQNTSLETMVITHDNERCKGGIIVIVYIVIIGYYRTYKLK